MPGLQLEGADLVTLGAGLVGVLGGIVAWAKKKDNTNEQLHEHLRELVEALGEATATARVQAEMCLSAIAFAKQIRNALIEKGRSTASMDHLIELMEGQYERTSQESDEG